MSNTSGWPCRSAVSNSNSKDDSDKAGPEIIFFKEVLIFRTDLFILAVWAIRTVRSIRR